MKAYILFIVDLIAKLDLGYFSIFLEIIKREKIIYGIFIKYFLIESSQNW